MKRNRPTVAQDLRELLALYDTDGIEKLNFVLRILPEARFRALWVYLGRTYDEAGHEAGWPRRTGLAGRA